MADDLKIRLNDLAAETDASTARGASLIIDRNDYAQCKTLPVASLAQIVAVPASATSVGLAGEVAYNTSFFYVCVAANTWRRVALVTF